MGYSDRDYYRDGPRVPSSRFADIPVVKWLLISNIMIFVVGVLMTTDPREPTVLDEWGVYSIRKGLQGMQVWRFLTFQFLHDGFFHLLFNMWVLFVFGPFLERWWRSKAFLFYYLLCGISGAAFYTLLVGIPGILPNASTDQGLVGASAGILGVLMGVAILSPRAEVRLLLPPVALKLRTLALILIGLDVLLLLMNTSNAGGSAGHLGGVLMGLLLMKNPVMRGLLMNMANTKGVSVKIVKKPKPESKFRPRTDVSAAESSEVDRILDKINNEGLQSLTDEERDLLKRAAGK